MLTYGLNQEQLNKCYNVSWIDDTGQHWDYQDTFRVFKTYQEAEAWAKDPVNNVSADYRIDTVENDYKHCEEA